LDINANDDTDSEDEHERQPSPDIVDPPPKGVAFRKLNLNQQFAYVKPVLVAILNERYSPAALRHQKFMQGGSARTKLARDAGCKGYMTGQEVSRLTKMITRWTLGEKAKAELIHVEAQGPVPKSEDIAGDEESQVLTPLSDLTRSPSPVVPSSKDSQHEAEGPIVQKNETIDTVPEVTVDSHPSRQQGSPAYERLTDVEKLDYCTNILVPEAVIQILLWRAEKRSTTTVSSDEEEERLHEIGLGLVHTIDWVNEIMQLRKTTRRSAQVDKPAEMMIVGGTSTRPKLKTGK